MKINIPFLSRDLRSNRAIVTTAVMIFIVVIAVAWLALLDLQTNRDRIRDWDHVLRADAQVMAKALESYVDEQVVQAHVLPTLARMDFLLYDEAAPAEWLRDFRVRDNGGSLIDYIFLIRSSNHDVLTSATGAYPDEVAQTLDLDSLFALAGRQYGQAHGGYARGPYGPFYYVFRFALTPVSNELVIRGAKIDPEAVREVVLPEAYAEARRMLGAQERGVQQAGVFAVQLATPDTTFMLNGAVPALSGRAVAAYEASLLPGGVFDNWDVRVHYYNPQRARQIVRYLAIVIPLLIVGLGVLVAIRSTSRVLELNHTKLAFVSNVSHELKTPLSKIRFFNDILRSGRVQTPEKQQRYFEWIEQECERLSLMVDNVLDFSRIERGLMTYSFDKADVSDVVNDVVETFNLLYETRGYHIEAFVEEDLPQMYLDANAIKQSLINLLDNAVKYSEAHTIHVRAFRGAYKKEPAVHLAVQDRGIGIPRDKQSEVFKEFYRVDTRLSQRVSGSGLGLAIVRHAAQAHGGTVSVESTVGVGSTFTLMLPVKPIKKEDSPGKEIEETTAV